MAKNDLSPEVEVARKVITCIVDSMTWESFINELLDYVHKLPADVAIDALSIALVVRSLAYKDAVEELVGVSEKQAAILEELYMLFSCRRSRTRRIRKG